MIAIQQRIVERLKSEIRESIGPASPAIDIYYEEYARELDLFERVSSKSELLDACAQASIVYCGDYHTLRQSQATAQKLIRELLDRRSDITIALEMVATDHQAILDRYVAGRASDGEFLRAIDYQRSWDFHWEPYRRILDLCRREGLRVLGINSDPKDSSSRLLDRDFHAAEVIAGATMARPDSLIFVLDGDLHVARDHLPLIVDSILRRKGLARRRVVVHQNAEQVYWRLAKRGLERASDVVRLDEDCYCVLSATPLVKLQSYLNWEQNHAELCGFVHPAWRGGNGDDEPDYVEQMNEIVVAIAGFLEIHESGLDDFSIYTSGDLDFFGRLRRDRRFSTREIAEIRHQVKASESYFIPRVNIIYLADLSIHRAAEEAAHFLNSVCAGFDGEPRDPLDAFYLVAVREAIGFFGSRIIDHKRYCMSFQDFRDFLSTNRSRRLALADRQLRLVARLALRHREAERTWMATGRFLGLPLLARRPPDLRNAVAHALGYILGDKLYNALVSGLVTKRYVRDLFYDPLPPGTARARYFDLVARLEGVEHRVPAERERF